MVKTRPQLEWIITIWRPLLLGAALGVMFAFLAPTVSMWLKFFSLSALSFLGLSFPFAMLWAYYVDRARDKKNVIDIPQKEEPVVRFRRLMELKSEGLITDFEYEQKRDEILREL